MSDIPTNHLLNFEHIADILYEELTVALPQLGVEYKTCLDYVFLAFDDFAVTMLAGKSIDPGATRLAVFRPGSIADISVFRGILANVDRHVLIALDLVIRFRTWGYIFIKRLGTTVRIEVTGDRRLDEWALLTNNGEVSLEEVLSNFTSTLKERAAGIIDGGETLIDIEEFARAVLRKDHD